MEDSEYGGQRRLMRRSRVENNSCFAPGYKPEEHVCQGGTETEKEDVFQQSRKQMWCVGLSTLHPPTLFPDYL